MLQHYLLLASASAFIGAATLVYFLCCRKYSMARKSWPIYISGYFASMSLLLFSWWLGKFNVVHNWTRPLADFILTLPTTALCCFILTKKRYRVFPAFTVYCFVACLTPLPLAWWHNCGSGSAVFYLSWLLPASGDIAELFVIFRIFTEACKPYPSLMRSVQWARLASVLAYSTFVLSSILENRYSLTVSYIASLSLSYDLLLLIPSGLLLILLLFRQVLALPVERMYLLIGIGFGLQSSVLLTTFALGSRFQRIEVGAIVLMNGLQGVICALYYLAMLRPAEIRTRNMRREAVSISLDEMIRLNKLLVTIVRKR